MTSNKTYSKIRNFPMGKGYFVRWVGKISGNEPGSPVEYLIFNTVTFFGCFFAFFKTIASILIDSGVYSIGFGFAAFLIMSSSYYLSRFRKKTKMLIIPFSSLLLLNVSVAWFFSGGILGPMPFAFFVFLLLSLSIRPSKTHFYLIGILSLIGSILVFFHFRYPEMILKSNPIEQNYSVHSVMLVLGLGFFGFLLWTMKSSFEKNRAEVIRKNEELSDFAHFISNDLKAPLRGIQHLSRFVLEENRKNIDGQGREMLEKVIASADKMTVLINDILTYTRVSENMGGKEDINLNELVEGVVSFLNPAKEVSIQYSNLPMEIYYDRIALHQVLQNLITNAIKYNDKSQPSIEISAHEKGRFYWVSVKDNGPGIGPENHEKVFKFLETLGNKSRGESGTGVGLAMVKKIVEQNEGCISIDSDIGRGATFLFSIPV